MTDDAPEDADGAEDDERIPPTPTDEEGESVDESLDREGPLGEIADEIDRRRETGEGPDLPADELFDESDVDGVDREALWRQVASEDVVEEIAESEVEPESVEPETAGPTVRRPDADDRVATDHEESGEYPERVVAKAKYCRGCEYFSAPPDVRCTHEGTEIAEEVDMSHFRVVNCPIVREDEELENV